MNSLAYSFIFVFVYDFFDKVPDGVFEELWAGVIFSEFFYVFAGLILVIDGLLLLIIDGDMLGCMDFKPILFFKFNNSTELDSCS